METMWNPDDKELEPIAMPEEIRAKVEFFSLLMRSEETRKDFGIRAIGDGTYWIGDLEKIKSFPEETRALLREFLKIHGKDPGNRPVSSPPPKPIATELKAGMSPETRAQLDALYRKIDTMPRTPSRLSRNPPESSN